MKVGDYTKVINVPQPWEGSGEEEEDLQSFVGHVGVVVEATIDGFVLLRFPHHGICDHRTGQRNFALPEDQLELVSSPPTPITECCYENS